MDIWDNCYNLGWKGLICNEAFSHPAKYSRGLIFHIIEHVIDERWVQPGQTILDPFGGVALGALPALMNGINWIGCELEPRFVDLGRQNIDLWRRKFADMPKFGGTAILLQGDSRRLSEVVREAGLVVSSPPYAESLKGDNKPDYTPEELEQAKIAGKSAKRSTWGVTNGAGVLTGKGYGGTDGNLGNLLPGDISAVISSPPFAGNTGGRGEASRNGIDAALFDRHSGGMKKGTGDDPANLDHLPMGKIEAVISSPPYADGCSHTGGNDPNPEYIQGNKRGAYGVTIISSPPFADSVGSDDPDKRGGLFRDPKRHNDVNLTGSYGNTPGQLGAMQPGQLAAVVSSLPFENQMPQQDKAFLTPHDSLNRQMGDYGSAPGQIGNDSGETFWAAALTIVQQCALVLPPGGVAIWVVKMYVKNGKLVDFPARWQQLCEACGFELIHEHRAMLVKNGGTKQATIDGESVSKETKRASFFRLLVERKGSPRIDWETVLCMRKKEQ